MLVEGFFLIKMNFIQIEEKKPLLEMLEEPISLMIVSQVSSFPIPEPL